MPETGNRKNAAMGNFSFIDESFDPNISLSYFFSIRLNQDGISFCTLDPIRNKYIQITNIVLNSKLPVYSQLDKHFMEIDILNLPYKKIFILIPTQTATLVPAAIFEQDKAKTFLDFCCNIPENSIVHFNKIRQADIYNIFAINKEAEEFFKRQFQEPVFFHQNTPLIDGFLSSINISDKETDFICINFNTDFFDVAIFKNSQLKLCNSFPLKNENDFLYFTLFTFEQLKLTENTTSVFVSGINDNRQKHIINLSRYISKIKQIDFPNNFRYSTIFKNYKISGFYNLLNLSSCV
jgi:hypothetical protein